MTSKKSTYLPRSCLISSHYRPLISSAALSVVPTGEGGDLPWFPVAIIFMFSFPLIRNNGTPLASRQARQNRGFPVSKYVPHRHR